MDQDNIMRFLNDLEDTKSEDIVIDNSNIFSIPVPGEVVSQLSASTDWKAVLKQCGMRVLARRAQELADFFKEDQLKNQPKPAEDQKGC